MSGPLLNSFIVNRFELPGSIDKKPPSSYHYNFITVYLNAWFRANSCLPIFRRVRNRLFTFDLDVSAPQQAVNCLSCTTLGRCFSRNWQQEQHQQRRRSALGCSPCYQPAIIARCHPRTGVVVRHLVPRRWWQLPPLWPPPLPAWWPCRTAKTSPRNSIR